jgi:polyisoprenoid-binding protein YceI
MNVVRFLICVVLFGPTLMPAHAQQKYTVQHGQIHFTSDAELELINASSAQVRGLLDPANNQFAFTIDVKTFKGFNSELQREHFNEKYMETERYPKASFSGKIIEQVDFSKPGVHEVRAKGELDIHGVKQTRIIKSKLTVTVEGIRIEAKFMVPLADHNITIPTVVSQKIATEIDVELAATMTLQ